MQTVRPSPRLTKMAAKGASLGGYNQELVRCIEDLREKREEVNRSILRDEEEKAKCQRDLTTITERLSKLNEGLARKMQARLEFDQTIQETEAAYMKILESSQTLLGVLKVRCAGVGPVLLLLRAPGVLHTLPTLAHFLCLSALPLSPQRESSTLAKKKSAAS